MTSKRLSDKRLEDIQATHDSDNVARSLRHNGSRVAIANTHREELLAEVRRLRAVERERDALKASLDQQGVCDSCFREIARPDLRERDALRAATIAECVAIIRKIAAETDEDRQSYERDVVLNIASDLETLLAGAGEDGAR
jgi:hypothetical protein